MTELAEWFLNLNTNRRPSKKTALGWHSYASRQSDAHQLRRQSLQCSWTSSLELYADGPQTAGLVRRPFQTVAEVRKHFIWSVDQKCSVNPPLNCASKILLHTFSMTVRAVWQWQRKVVKRFNNIVSYEFLWYVGHVTIFSWMATIAWCLVVKLVLGLRLGLGSDLVSGWLLVKHTHLY